jgi:5-formyltetrahydrofolate cyclo-ligase
LVAPHLARGANLGAYVPTRGEIDPLPLLARIRSRSVALPRIEGDNVEFRQINLPETTGSGPANSEWGWDRLGLSEGPFEILEPPTTAPRLDLRAVSVLLVPLVAFDDECHRIGFGKGYYDRALGALPEGEHPILIGLAHEFQRLPRWLPDPWDVGLDMVATPAGVVLPGG